MNTTNTILLLRGEIQKYSKEERVNALDIIELKNDISKMIPLDFYILWYNTLLINK
jgi:hypothetical protein